MSATITLEKTKTILEEIEGGVCAPNGFKAAGMQANIRKPKKDLAIITSDVEAAVAGVFTLNKAAAAPIQICKRHLQKSSVARAVVVNSGNANACTGEQGLHDAKAMVNETAKALGVAEEQIWVSSTGVIGQPLPMQKILPAIVDLSKTLANTGGADAAAAIMTTDTFPKEIAVKFTIDGKDIHIGAIAKGSGMIAPNMATMLGFVTTDANIPQPLLQKALSRANEVSFNRISVDGDCSTNDMVMIMANGLAENEAITNGSENYMHFYAALEYVLTKLAKMIVKDGEGATKLIEIHINGARSEAEATEAARAIANSPLVKTAFHASDANWGRIMAAIGYSGIDVAPENIEISFGDVPILKRNFDIMLDESKAKEVLLKSEFEVNINLNQGEASATFWTCDLSAKYVEINGSYRS
jgi:glutamate N-acetyltransferase / amino-acid N-acetyltransferase